MDDHSLAYEEDRENDPAAAEEADFETDADALPPEPAAVERQIPGISIEAFVELEKTRALIADAGEDRRMKRAHVSAQAGGLPAAIERYQSEPSPDLIILETGMRGPALFGQLDDLAALCDAKTKVIVVGAANDVSLYRGLLRRGVSEYLIPPLTPVHLIRAVSEIYGDPEAPFHGKTIAFVPAKGGCGSSTVAHNTAWCIAETIGVSTTIVDLDLAFGTASLDFNQDAMQGVGEALSQPERLDDILLERLITRCTEHLSLFSAPATVDRDW
ncbi:MAG: pilus assembly protein CpaE, partial [Caulobacterales bacterium]|nr:pilus assembly protein CpaE [Caulobacterales bacterium]